MTCKFSHVTLVWSGSNTHTVTFYLIPYIYMAYIHIHATVYVYLQNVDFILLRLAFGQTVGWRRQYLRLRSNTDWWWRIRVSPCVQDIDWVQTEKHVFEQASTNPFLVGLHSCFQTESRWARRRTHLLDSHTTCSTGAQRQRHRRAFI